MRYLIFDCLAIDNASLLHRTLDKRLAYCRDKIYNPYQSLYAKYPNEQQYLPFLVVFKTQERSYGIEMVFRQILPKLPHGNDGLIFTCRTTPYKPGTDPHILKWKPANENSVDFRLRLEIPLCELDSEDEEEGITAPYPDYSVMPIFHLAAGGDGHQDIAYGTMHVTQQEWEDLKSQDKPLDLAIVECYQDENHQWRFMRFREDKLEPNHISTVESVIESIQDRIGDRELIALGPKIRDSWKAREAAEAASARKGSVPPGPQSTNGVHPSKRKVTEIIEEVDGANKRRHTP